LSPFASTKLPEENQKHIIRFYYWKHCCN